MNLPAFASVCVCVCVCVLMTSSWSAKSLHVEGHSFRSPPLGVMNFKRNLEGERNLQLETAGQFSWAVSAPPPKEMAHVVIGDYLPTL